MTGSPPYSSKQKIAELEQAVAQADALADMKSNFLATMSHEIRTPMQTIYGILELIDEENPDEKISNLVDIAREASSGLLEILDDVLDLAKVDAGKMELDVFEVPVRLLVRGLLEALAVKVHSAGIDLVDNIEQDVPFVVVGDPKRLRQIIMNLCGNALKFTEKGTVTVHVTTNVQHITIPEGGVGLRFEIIDTGIGMSEQACARLFQNFAQADSSTSRKYGGTGLGLSISKKLVELMDGQIGVQSQEGKGSTFWFEIPTIEVDTDKTTVDLPDLTGISVLSVEDHPQGAKEIMNSLRSMGATVESCPTYAEGLALARRRPFDVAVIDQGLPDGLGLDLIKEIMKIRPGMGMVMYTVRDDIGLSHSLKALGATYLTKPASRAGLGEAVKNTARKHNLSIDGPRKLLIAEDTDSVQEILKRQLEKIGGVEATFVENGKQALEAIQTGEYGIVFTDLHMPEMDGYALVNSVRESEADTDKHFPVIVLTADVQMAQRETYMRHGFDECLLKPVSLGQFRGLLMRWGLLEHEHPKENGESAEDDTIQPQDNAPGQRPPQDAKPPAIDRQAMIDQMGAFDDMAIEMLGMFADMTAPLIVKIREAHTHKDLHDIKEAAHSLKGAARSACCNVLGDLAADLQDAAEDGQYGDDLIPQIETEFERVKTEIAAL
ncbi:MAG: hybrid sensor histidine kinase/response regulator [Micavibrio sp.]|nr:hybrid sensor histidine kinase/response regulator [Micavibrio sp.]